MHIHIHVVILLLQGQVGIQKCWFLRRGKTRVPGEKPLRARERTNNKLNPHVASIMGFEPGPHWWEASALTSSHHFATLAPMLLFSNMEILNFNSFISIADDGNWIHPVEWERAAEELTWERVRIFYIKPVTQSGPMQLFKRWIVLSIRYITWLYISILGNQVSFHWIEIYPVDNLLSTFWTTGSRLTSKPVN